MALAQVALQFALLPPHRLCSARRSRLIRLEHCALCLKRTAVRIHVDRQTSGVGVQRWEEKEHSTALLGIDDNIVWLGAYRLVSRVMVINHVHIGQFFEQEVGAQLGISIIEGNL